MPAWYKGLAFVFVFLLAALTARSGFGLALFIARLLVMLVLTSLLKNAGLLKLLLKPLQRAIERFVRPHLNLRQTLSPLCISSTVRSHSSQTLRTIPAERRALRGVNTRVIADQTCTHICLRERHPGRKPVNRYAQ